MTSYESNISKFHLREKPVDFGCREEIKKSKMKALSVFQADVKDRRIKFTNKSGAVFILNSNTQQFTTSGIIQHI